MEEVNVYNTYVTNDENKKIYYLDVDEISDFPDHPYHVIEDESLMELSESIKKYGVMVPLIVRLVDNKYQMVAGHRRKAASILAEQYKVPCIIKELSDEDAIITMVDSNIQRENILPSEKAFAYKMRMDAIKRKGGRPRKNNVVPLAHNFQKKTSRQLIGEQVGESQDQVRRYIRLTYLIKPILDMVDEKKIALRPAVELSYLSSESQGILLEVMGQLDCTPSHAQAIQLRKLEEESALCFFTIEQLLSEQKGNQKEQLKVPLEKIERYFSPGTSPKTMEKTILEALEMYYRLKVQERRKK
ncbi:ParB/RepB/Spo0J family partition protein [Anaerotignum lactatifermentans]|uniref:ParB/RepB/Spo0J family partition protein n=1 Tax=Anaerotignum lactatifermentans TaxID=160404 RepID=UPI00187400F0|nr:ParB/RepB/Spo0J family partition protein [Anaerotignum lactatifermentans]MBE5077550.1 ParB/RepB/Spo0J family partition protein [Anaerotignum lactatifermentans]